MTKKKAKEPVVATRASESVKAAEAAEASEVEVFGGISQLSPPAIPLSAICYGDNDKEPFLFHPIISIALVQLDQGDERGIAIPVALVDGELALVTEIDHCLGVVTSSEVVKGLPPLFLALRIERLKTDAAEMESPS